MHRLTVLVVALCSLAQCQYNAWQSQPWVNQRPVRQYWPQQQTRQYFPQEQQVNYWPQEPQPYQYQQPQIFPISPYPNGMSPFPQAVNYRAIAKLSGLQVNGNVSFYQDGDGPVKVQGEINGLNDGHVGFHVHEKGDLSGGCMTLGAHFNPEMTNHGAPEDRERHVGDLGNIESRGGKAYIDIVDSKLSLHGPHSIIGRGLVVHAAVDDLGRTNHPDSKKTGNAGGRVSCGVIGIQEFPNSSSISTASTALLILSFAFVINFF